jgi:hypothetical protein
VTYVFKKSIINKRFMNVKKNISITIAIQFGFISCLMAQKPVAQGAPISTNGTTIATIPVKLDTVKAKKSDFPNPKTALLWSIAPSGGQFYNQKYWYIKVPLALGGYGFGIERIVSNGKSYRNLQDAYVAFVNPTDGRPVISYDAEFKKQQRDKAFKAYQQSWIFTTIWHLFCAAEAFTAAHLAHFDVNEDLSWQIRRGMELTPACTANGFGIQLKF